MYQIKSYVLSTMLLGSFCLMNSAQADMYTNTAITAETPTSQFTFDSTGTATDTKTGLMWQRCPVGTNYSNAGTPTNYTDDLCTAENALLSWPNALKAAQTANTKLLSGYGDWRVPHLPELKSIVEHRNYDPAINPVVFPSYNSSAFWTSTPPGHSGYENSATAIFFKDGDDIWPKRSAELYVRLVRTAQ